MDILCSLGIHAWRSKPTARPGVTVHRCERCNAAFTTRQNRGRPKKRHWLLGTFLASLSLWYVIGALSLTGHTKVIWGAEKVAAKAHSGAARAERKYRAAVGAPDPRPKNSL